MYIDDEKVEFDLSDHHLMETYFEIQKMQERKSDVKEIITYMKINNQTK